MTASEPKLRFSPVGSTGLSVSSIGFGTSALGDMPETYGYNVDEKRARETLRAIFDGPSNFIDTSRVYGLGNSEIRIGDAIEERGGLPKDFVLSTKLDRDLDTGLFNASQARRSLDQSLKALRIDQIPILHLHDPEYASDLRDVTRDGGAIDELFKIKEQGLVKAVGLAMGRLDIMGPLVRAYPFDTLISHNRYTLLNRSADALFSYAHDRGIAIFNAAPYAGGVLAKGSVSMPRITYQEASDEGLNSVRAIESLCDHYNVPMGAAALQFSINDPRITSTLIGVSKGPRVFETFDWMATSIPSDLLEFLHTIRYEVTDPEKMREYSAT
jgi:D-threo-aldose 1-dehydrogenase